MPIHWNAPPTWSNQLDAATALPTPELERHADVSRRNRHRCQACFCCAAWTILERRQERDARIGAQLLSGRR